MNRKWITIFGVVGLASLFACASVPSRDAAGPNPTPAGPWLVDLTQNGGTELAVLMAFEPQAPGRFTAYSRPGAAAEMLSWHRATLARVLGKLPPRGALLHIENGIAQPHGDSILLRGKLTSPFLGQYFLSGAVTGGRLKGELRRDSLGVVAGTIEGQPYRGNQPVRDYRALAANVHRTVAERVFDPQLMERPEWRGFFRDLERRFGAARDDADVLAAFYALKSRLRTSHFDLFRAPTYAALPADSLLSGFDSRSPDALVNLSFPAPGVAHLRVTRWNRVTPAVNRAFARIDSVRPHTLILDIRGNPGGDVSSMAPASHLLRDSTYVGVFLGQKWYREHRSPPTSAERAALPTLSDDRATTVLYGVREHGAIVGIVPPVSPRYDGPVYLLVDRGSGSASEPLAHLLKATGRATLVGENTAGAMLSGPPFPVGQGWILRVPEADYYTADGIRLEGSGVAPHIAVKSADALALVAERIRQSDPYAGALLLGRARLDAQDFAEAERWNREAQRLQPDSAAPVYGLGRTYQARKQWDLAFSAFEQALSKRSNDPAILYQVGRTAALSGQRLERGEQALREYLRRPPPPGEPTHAAAHWRLGLIHEKGGQRDAARREYEIAIQLEPENADFRASLQGLER